MAVAEIFLQGRRQIDATDFERYFGKVLKSGVNLGMQILKNFFHNLRQFLKKTQMTYSHLTTIGSIKFITSNHWKTGVLNRF